MASFIKNVSLSVLKCRNFSSSGPVKWLENATTYSEVQTAFVDPCTSLPYPEEDLRRLMKKHNASKQRGLREVKEKSVTQLHQKLSFNHIPIESQVVVMLPGQGAQTVGMGKNALSSSGGAALFKQASEFLQYDLQKLCLEGPTSKLDQTIYCQPAIFVSSLAAWEKAKEDDGSLYDRLTDVAGFSVGELAALVIAESLSFEDALRLVKIRAEAMHECSQRMPSGMLTVRVCAASHLDEALEDARTHAWEKGEMPVCEIANFLCCGVKVIGASETCIQFLEHMQEKYAFQIVKRLAVSSAFHTSLMNDAVGPLRNALNDVEVNPPRVNVYSNYTGKCHTYKVKQMKEAIIKQICSPVKWEQILHLLHAKHQDYKFPTYMEVGPGRQLGAMLFQTSKKAYKRYVNCPA